MTKIVYLPLDERPCNYMYPMYLAGMTDLNLALPDRSILGDKKRAADSEAVLRWLIRESRTADYAIISIDMLLYGGIVPSRLHTLPPEQCTSRLDVLQQLKAVNPKLRLYAFHLITRAPAYSSSEEEPEYYADYGRELNENGMLRDKAEGEGLTALEQDRLDSLQHLIPVSVMADFINRRKTNIAMNEQSLQLVADGTIDHLVVPLDDNAKYGYTAMDQRKMAAQVNALELADRVAIYPGADEIGCTLFARVFTEVKQYEPIVHVRYSSTNGPLCIPKYEDRSLNESIKCHLTAAGAIMGDSAEYADIQLMVHSPAVGQTDMAETMDRYEDRHRSYFSEVNIREFAHVIRHYAKKGKLIALADVALCNGGDHSLMKLLWQMGLLPAVACYAAWNTSGNSIGTVISHAIIEAYSREAGNAEESRMQRSKLFYYYRLIEDWGYQSLIRQEVSANRLPLLSADDFRLTHVQREVEAIIEEELQRFVQQYLPELQEAEVRHLYLPWKRMFEIGFEIHNESGVNLLN